MLPLGLCRFKDRCYIKTARDHVQHQEKALKKIPLHSAPSRFFLFCVGGLFFYMSCRLVIGVDWQCPGPITWQSDSVKTP